MKIKLNELSKIKEFITIAEQYNGDVFLCSGPYTIDGKSVLGILSLDLSQPIDLVIAIEGYSLFSQFEDK